MKAAMRTKDDKDEELTALRQEVQVISNHFYLLLLFSGRPTLYR